MQQIRINNRLPQVYRVYKAPTTTARTMSLFPRFVQSEFAPMFRLLDDYSNHVAGRGSSFPSSHLRAFQPRFDVKENKDNYELHGELPGIDQKDVSIEFYDNTLTIKGRTERTHEEGTHPAAAVEGQTEQPKITEGESDGYHKATVEDETTMSGANPDASTVEVTPAESTTEETPVASEAKQEVAQQPKSNASKYWVSERSVGEFSRTFSFPNRVDEEHVKASLKNGILSVVVPKLAAPASKRITVE
jgi:HSP20 family molecular chaperone IbpA